MFLILVILFTEIMKYTRVTMNILNSSRPLNCQKFTLVNCIFPTINIELNLIACTEFENKTMHTFLQETS